MRAILRIWAKMELRTAVLEVNKAILKAKMELRTAKMGRWTVTLKVKVERKRTLPASPRW